MTYFLEAIYMNIGIIGAGAIANFLLEHLQHEQDINITSVLVRDKEKYEALQHKYHVTLYTDVELFLQEEIDVVVEAANIEAVKSLIPTIIRKKSAVLISVGALVDEELLAELTAIANAFNQSLYLPSGAIGGLDLLQNAHALGNVTSVALMTRKPASSLVSDQIQEPTIIFQGTAEDAIAKYPKNMNVSIVLALAGVGFKETTVTLVADPTIEQNIHQIYIKGDFGEAKIEVKNNPLPANPKTSYLAAMSILGTLKRMNNTIRLG